MRRACSGVVLAGGLSRRMGRDKARIEFRGATLVARAVSLLREVLDEVMVVGGPAARLADAGADAVFEDDVRDAGPLGGILTGLRRIRAPRGFFVACDMPLLDARAVAAILDEADAAGDGVEAVVPEIDGRPEPLHAVYAKSCAAAIEALIASGDLRARALAETVKARHWDPVAAGFDPRIFANVNEPRDLEALEGEAR